MKNFNTTDFQQTKVKIVKNKNRHFQILINISKNKIKTPLFKLDVLEEADYKVRRNSRNLA